MVQSLLEHSYELKVRSKTLLILLFLSGCWSGSVPRRLLQKGLSQALVKRAEQLAGTALARRAGRQAFERLSGLPVVAQGQPLQLLIMCQVVFEVLNEEARRQLAVLYGKVSQVLLHLVL